MVLKECTWCCRIVQCAVKISYGIERSAHVAQSCTHFVERNTHGAERIAHGAVRSINGAEGMHMVLKDVHI
jgi:hypothetical protein